MTRTINPTALSDADEHFLKVYNDLHAFPSTELVALALELSSQTVKNRATILRKAAAAGGGFTVASRIHPSVPMSEDPNRYKGDWDRDQCIEELQRVAKIDPDRVVSRNYFRINSAISESTWNRFFGTFEEFKRQAGLKLTRQQHGLERHIAKHASVDHYRAMNAERRDYAGTYARPTTPGRFKTMVIASDLHDEVRLASRGRRAARRPRGRRGRSRLA